MMYAWPADGWRGVLRMCGLALCRVSVPTQQRNTLLCYIMHK